MHPQEAVTPHVLTAPGWSETDRSSLKQVGSGARSQPELCPSPHSPAGSWGGGVTCGSNLLQKVHTAHLQQGVIREEGAGVAVGPQAQDEQVKHGDGVVLEGLQGGTHTVSRKSPRPGGRSAGSVLREQAEDLTGCGSSPA